MSENSASCTFSDTEVTFSSADHLEWNQKKHDMILNLGLTNNNSEADQTPTPTRFIRNCEEVGLFQDLQNVNPFDQVFKEAVENPSSVSLRVPVSSSDDTLHTPQIYPHLEENPKFSSSNITATSNEYSLNTVISSIEHEGDDGDNSLVIVLESETEDKTLKDSTENKVNTSQAKITSMIVSKDKMKQKVIAAIIQKTSSGISPVPIEKLMDQKKPNPEYIQKNMAELLQQREANKAAQIRCRKRKRREFEQMSADIQKLKKENVKLTGINLYLQEKIKNLESELRATRSSGSMDTIALSAISLPPKTLPVYQLAENKQLVSQSTENKQLEPVIAGNQVKVNSCKKANKLPSIAPNVKAMILTAPAGTLTLPEQNIPNSSNNTVVVLCPGYVPSQNIIIPPTSILAQPGVDLKPKSKTSYKKIVPK